MSHYRVIEAEQPKLCELCGKVAQTRPYGPNGERVCFPCGKKDPEAMKRGFRKLVMEEP